MGEIRSCKSEDGKVDLYHHDDDDLHENPYEKITIECHKNFLITSRITRKGYLVPKSGYHYYHSGEFVHSDTLEIFLGGFGRLGGSWSHEITAVRKR